MTTPFRTLDLAIKEANVLASSLRAHGQITEVIIESGRSALDMVPAHIASAALKATYQAH